MQLGFDTYPLGLEVRRGLGLSDTAVTPRATVDTTLAALELAASGAGCALAHRLFLNAYIATGRLVPAIDREFTDDNSYFVLTPERPQRPRREVLAFRDWLIGAAKGF